MLRAVLWSAVAGLVGGALVGFIFKLQGASFAALSDMTFGFHLRSLKTPLEYSVFQAINSALIVGPIGIAVVGVQGLRSHDYRSEGPFYRALACILGGCVGLYLALNLYSGRFSENWFVITQSVLIHGAAAAGAWWWHQRFDLRRSVK